LVKDSGKAKKSMGSFKENPDGLSQLEALVNLLIDLQITQPNNISSKASGSTQESVKNQSEEFSVLSVEDRIKNSPVPETNFNQEKQEYPQEEQPKENVTQSNEDLVFTSLQNLVIPSEQQTEKIESDTNKLVITEEESEHVENLAPNVETESEDNSTLISGIKKDNTEEFKNRQPLVEEDLKVLENLNNFAEPGDQQKNTSGRFEEKESSSVSQAVNTEIDLGKKEDLEATKAEYNSSIILPETDKQIAKSSNVYSQEQANLQQSEKNAISSKISTSPSKFQYPEEKSEASISASIVTSDNAQREDESILLERLQRLLVPAEILGSREVIVNIKEKVINLEHHIYEPAELINLLLPLITEILSIKIAEAREEVVNAIAPIIDGMIEAKTQQDKVAISSALAPLISEAVTERVSKSPGEIAEALAPEIGIAIKQQIALERDAMVDALYPVIGSIIAKYMTEVMKAINEKVENAFSVEGFLRKFRAKMQGVSEAELMLQEATPFTVKAIFLIHKASGLVIAEAQSKDNQHLESEMVAGMLTAIRSFVNDCIAQAGDISEVDQINYGSSKIILEVAGYCYLAVVTQGNPPKIFMRKMRASLAKIIQSHGKAIELFDGDPDNVPEQVSQLVGGLTKVGSKELSVVKDKDQDKERKPPVALLAIVATVISLILIPWGIFQFRAESNRRLEGDINLALASEPELAVYHLKVEADGDNLKLAGKLPNQYLRTKAEEIAKKVQPKLNINNAIIAIKAPADKFLAEAEVKRLTSIFNQMDGVEISSSYDAGKVTVEGTVLQVADTKKITQAFEQIPGVESVSNTVQLQTQAIASRIYFERASSQLKPTELAKIIQLKEFFNQYPNKSIKIIGHSDKSGTNQENQRLALERAKVVRDMLVNQGIDTRKLQVAGNTSLPYGVDGDQPLWLSRCVQFEIITP
jgi:outer membrane protein OmpA-like peptidoglycan-associated protein